MTVAWFKNKLVPFFSLTFLLLAGCSDPTEVGSSLLAEDTVQVEVVDTFEVQARTVPGEAVQTFSPFSALSGYMVNHLDDPVFGISRANPHLQARLEFRNPDFSDAQADSLVLVMAYDTAGFYGDLEQPFTLNVHRLVEFIDQNDVFLSDTTVSYDPRPIGSVTFTPNRLDTVTFIDFAQGQPQIVQDVVLRIPLDPALAEEFINYDTTIYQSDTSFIRAFNGLRLEAPNPTASSLSFDLFDNRSGLYLFYRRDTVLRQFRYGFGSFSTKFITFEHDYTGSPIEPFLQDTGTDNDSILFTQGMAGVNVAFRFPGLDQLDNVVLNKAELSIYSARVEGDQPENYPPADQLIFYVRDETGRLVPVEDVELATDDIPQRFGGAPEAAASGEGVVYRFILTSYLQDVIDGRSSGELFLSTFPRPERATRTILQNPAAGAEKIRLELTYSRIN